MTYTQTKEFLKADFERIDNALDKIEANLKKYSETRGAKPLYSDKESQEHQEHQEYQTKGRLT